jgi:hypothetical protein
MARERLTGRDREQLRSFGISEGEARRQLALLAEPPAPLALDRPATVGDGILRLERADQERLAALCDEAQRAGRLSKFVPASGAATRLFRSQVAVLARWESARLTRLDLRRASQEGDRDAAETVSLMENLPRFAFFGELIERFGRSRGALEQLLERGHWSTVLELLLGSDGLGYAELPKGLIPFHAYPDGPRTAFEEHLAEGRSYLSDASGRVCLHCTVAPGYQGRFEEALARAESRLGEPGGYRFEVSFSHQERSTDTIALHPHGGPVRLADGSLLLRPGGHGSLLRNLERCGGDLVLIQNIDNVLPESRVAATARWRRILAGLVVDLERELFRHLDCLEAGGGQALAAAQRFAAERLSLGDLDARREGASPGQAAGELRERLARPLRVCAMVANRGEPGGGPFWVKDATGAVSLQIIEAGQVDLSSAGQQAILRAATHFNPVDLVCALRDRSGRPHALAPLVDPQAAFVSSKAFNGQPILALEHPGLWNGAMAGWLTVFVEVPAETFAPVKTVLDLLRPEHRG